MISETPIGQDIAKIAFGIINLQKTLEEDENLSFLVSDLEDMQSILNRVTNEILKYQFQSGEEL